MYVLSRSGKSKAYSKPMNIEVVIGDITQQKYAEAVVHSANPDLFPGAGISGSLHKAAGPELEAYCKQFAPAKYGTAVLTPGFGLPNRWVIHAVAAPFETDGSEEILASAVGSVMATATHYGIQSIAFPALGIGLYRFPISTAINITLTALAKHARGHTTVKRVRICVMQSVLIRARYVYALQGCY